MTRDELFNHATVFEFGEIQIVRSPIVYPEGDWYIRKGELLLHPKRGWILYVTAEDGSFLFKSPLEAAAHLNGGYAYSGEVSTAK